MALNKNKPTPEQIDQFVEFAQKAESKIPLPIPLYKSVPSALAQGAMGAYAGLAKMAGSQATFGDEPRAVISPFDTESQQVARKQLQEAETLGSDIESKAEEYFPIGDSFIPKAVRRGSRAFLDNVYFGLSGALRSVAGAGLAEGAKEMGAPGWMQTSIELGAQIAPDFGKTLTKRGFGAAADEERRLINEARRLGMTEEELALTLNQRGPVKEFTQDIAAKGGRMVGRFQKTKAALGRVWETLRTTPEAQAPLSLDAKEALVQSISERMSRMPSAQRDLISQDWADLRNSNMQGTDLIDFWQKLNYHIARGEGALGNLKQDLQKGISSISEQLGNDFQITNQLYANFHRLAERMGPNIAENLIRTGENGIVLTAITTGNFPLLSKVLKPLGARQLATELSTNPRLMNLSSKMINALERGSPVIAKQIYNQLVIEVGKTNAEAAMKMSDIDFDEFFKSLPKSNKKNNNME